jgi:putative transposase
VIRELSSKFSVKKMCPILEVSRSAYYRWIKNPIAKRRLEDIIITADIKRIHKESYGTYGQRRIKSKLGSEGKNVSCSRIGKIMNENGIYSRLKRKFKSTTNSKHNYPIKPDLLKRDFKSKKPNNKWVGDITYVPTEEGYIYLAAVEDLFDNQIIGWSIDDRMKTDLTVNAIKMAISKEQPCDGTIFHSDRGSQYAAYRYQDLLRQCNIRQSMSRKGNCFDNACAESFFATMKKDIIHGIKYRTKLEAKLKIIEYIEMFYNCKRISNKLGYKSPKQFRKEYELRNSA